MTEIRTRDMPLNRDVFVTPGIPVVTALAFGARGQTVMWESPIKD
jgi:hypothetical protein